MISLSLSNLHTLRHSLHCYLASPVLQLRPLAFSLGGPHSYAFCLSEHVSWQKRGAQAGWLANESSHSDSLSFSIRLYVPVGEAIFSPLPALPPIPPVAPEVPVGDAGGATGNNGVSADPVDPVGETPPTSTETVGVPGGEVSAPRKPRKAVERAFRWMFRGRPSKTSANADRQEQQRRMGSIGKTGRNGRKKR